MRSVIGSSTIQRNKDEDSLQGEPKEWSRILDELRAIWKEYPPDTVSALSSKFRKVHCRILSNQTWVNFWGIKIDCSFWLNLTGKRNHKQIIQRNWVSSHIHHDEKQFKRWKFYWSLIVVFILDLESGRASGKDAEINESVNTQTGTSRIKSVSKIVIKAWIQAFAILRKLQELSNRKIGNFGTEKLETEKRCRSWDLLYTGEIPTLNPVRTVRHPG